MKIILTVHWLAAALMLTGLGPKVSGAETAAQRTAPQVEPADSIPDASVTRTPQGSPRFNLDIIGGMFEPRSGVRKVATIGSLVEFVRATMPDVNIVLSPGTAEIRVQELRLRSVRTEEFLQALTVATGESVQWRRAGDQNYSLMSRPAPEQRVEVFNLSPYIAHALASRSKSEPDWDKEVGQVLVKLQQMILETVEFASERGADRSLDMRFHSDASLLVARGTPKAIEVVRKFVSALNEPFSKEKPVRRDLLEELSVP